MQSLMLALAAAAAGALIGALATWWTQDQQDKVRDRRSSDRALREKLHELELRILKVEVETRAYTLAGRRDARQSEGADA